MMFFGLIFLVLGGLVLLALIIGVVAFVSGWRPDFIEKSSNYSPSSKEDDTALEILNERYAHGEIEEEEYLKMKKSLKS